MMTLLRRGSLIASIVLLICASRSRADAPAAPHDLFDTTKYMHISEIHPGMKGYGVSVFKGNKLERFNVEVLSVLKNFNPKDDVILITCQGANLEHTGAIAGMSGSPIYLHDDQGRDRMIGAFAYGWPLVKDPIAGVQPIEYMLALPDNPIPPTTAPTTAPAMDETKADAGADASQPHALWSLSDTIPMPGKKTPASYPLISGNRFEPNVNFLTGSGDPARMQPLATPLMTTGLSGRMLEQFGPLFRAYGLVPLQAGGIGGVATVPTTQQADDLAPGSVLAAPLLTGDADMTAVGTCTEVIGDRVFGFGHPFNSEGKIDLPLGAGQINAIVAELTQSFKLGSLTRIVGTITTDQTVGISGHVGAAPAMMPIDLHVLYTDGSQDSTYHFQSVLHPKFTPMLGVAALTAAITGQHELPQDHTIEYDINLEFANGRTLAMKNMIADNNPASLFMQVAGPMIAASDNPYGRVLPKKMSGTIRVTPESKQAEILSVNVPKLKFKPGETVNAYVEYRRYRGVEATLPVELQLPRDLPDGTYQMSVGGWERYLQDELTARPFRFSADNVSDVFDVLSDFESVRHDAVYVRLLRQADGVALGRIAMARLPSSVRQVMLDAGRSNTTPFISSDVKVFPTGLVMEGAADFAVTIETSAHLETGRTRPEMPNPVTPQPPGDKGKKSEVPVEPTPPK